MKSQTPRTVKRIEPIRVPAKQAFWWCLLPVALFLGCGPAEPAATPTTDPAQPEQKVAVPSPAVLPRGFLPVQIEILPLTELADGGQGTELNVYVSLLDAYREKIKAPGTLRFELYDYVQRSAEPKGQRLAIWPDLDLSSPAENQKYWRDFLRAYEFTLGTQASRDKTYILEVTCLCPSGKRLSAEWPLKPEE